MHLRDLVSPVSLSFSPLPSCLTWNTAGVFDRHIKDLKLPPEERYIQSIVTTPEGRLLIITMVPYLASLVHVARTVQVDTTFGRTAGNLNEWEFVLWYGSVERGESHIAIH